jgi:hypothetical protein
VVAAATVAVPVAESATPVPAGTFSQPTHDALAVAIKAVLSTPATDAPAASDAITNMVSAAREQSVADALAVEQVARHGEQCLPASFLEWFLSHGDAFYEDPNGLWQMVIGEGVVAADAKQMQGVLGLRAQVIILVIPMILIIPIIPIILIILRIPITLTNKTKNSNFTDLLRPPRPAPHPRSCNKPLLEYAIKWRRHTRRVVPLSRAS